MSLSDDDWQADRDEETRRAVLDAVRSFDETQQKILSKEKKTREMRAVVPKRREDESEQAESP